MEIQEDFEVASPIEVVFETLIDVEHIGYCIAGVKTVTLTSPTESDWVVEVRAGTIQRTLEFAGRMTDATRPEMIAFEARGQDVELKGSVRLRAVDRGITACTVQIDAVVTGPFALLAELMAQGPQRQLIEQTIANIRALLDGVAPSPAARQPFKVSVWAALGSLLKGITSRVVRRVRTLVSKSR